MKIQPINMQVNYNRQINSTKIDSIMLKRDTEYLNVFLKTYSKINFEGLNKSLSKRAFNNVDILLAELAKHPKSNGMVGNLPAEWVIKIPRAERADKIKTFYKDLNLAINEFRINPKKLLNLRINLTIAFRNAGIIQDKKKIKLKPLKEGAYGEVYKLTGIDNKEYVIKIFHSQQSENSLHGNPIELNRAAYWKKNAGNNTQKIRFYFGDTDAGYMVNKYISKRMSHTPHLYKHENIYGLYNGDKNIYNEINGFQIDYGGLEISNPILAENKTARYIYNKFFKLSLLNKYKNTTNEMSKLFANLLLGKKYKNNPDIKIGLIVALDLFPQYTRLNKLRTLTAAIDFNDSKNISLKEALTKVLTLFPETELSRIFDKLLIGADNKLKIALLNSLQTIPQKLHILKLQKLLEGADAEFKTEIVNDIPNLTSNRERLYIFNKLLTESDNEIKHSLARHLYCLPAKKRCEIFTKLLAGADNNLKVSLACVLHLLSVDERCEQFNKLLVGADNNLKIELIYNLHLLTSKEHSLKYAEFLKDTDKDIKLALANVFINSPKDEVLKNFMQLLESADDDIKKVLLKKVNRLPKKERPIYQKLLKQHNPTFIDKILLSFLRFKMQS